MTEFLPLPGSAECSRWANWTRHFLQGLGRAPQQTVALAVGAVMCLSGCSVRDFTEAQQKARDASVKANMHTVQIAAESYATDHNGNYPTDIDANFKSYFPGGSSGAAGANSTAGTAPINPFTRKPEWPVIGHVTDVVASRQDAKASLGKGVVEYSPIGGSPATSYAIRGGGADEKVIPVPNNYPPLAMVLSNK